MTNILIEGYSSIPSYELTVKDFICYSTVLPINVRTKLSRNITNKDILWSDILVCVRGDNPLSALLAKKAKKCGRKIILVLDDDLIEFHSLQNSFIDKISRGSLENVLSMASSIITTSAYLGEKYKKSYGIKYVIADTIVEETEIKHYDHNDDRVKIIHAAGTGHNVFFTSLISPILHDLYDKYKDKVSLTIIGPNVDISSVEFPAAKYESMSFDEYQNFMRSNVFDIGLAPLLDCELTRSKYYNKYLEYTRNDICGIYSNVLPYSLVVRDGHNGFLADNTKESWFNCICRAIDNKLLRQKLVHNAQYQVTTDFCLHNITYTLLRNIPFLSTYKAEVCNIHHNSYMYLRFLSFEFFRRLLSYIQ